MPANRSHREQVLRIDTTVSVTLAQRKLPLARILELVPGTLIRFDKHHTAAVDVETAGRQLASGEVVRIGDRIGVRLLPRS